MGGHRRVTNVDYDDDDVEDYDDAGYEDGGAEEMNASDKAQLEQGTVHVKALLGPDIACPDQEIQESLWYYYFDVDKTASYLRGKYAPKPKTKKQAPLSRFDQAALNAAQSQTKNSNDSASYPIVMPQRDCQAFSAAEFFKDTPWLNVPAHRLGNITIEPLYPRGRLLGGASKPSKLAALAAARRKRQEEQEASSSSVPSPDNKSIIPQSNRAVSLLDRLGASGKEQTSTPGQVPSQDLPVRGTTLVGANRSYPPRKQQLSDPEPEQTIKEPQPVKEESSSPVQAVIQDLHAEPSAFAATIIWGTAPRNSSFSTAQGIQSFPLPFANFPAFAKSNPFAGPSPDDIVANAQAKGNKNKGTKSKEGTNDNGVKGIAEGMTGLKVEGGQDQTSARVRSKNLDVLKEFEKSNMKQAASFVVVGHVDHGKSTLMGRLLFDMKVIDQRSVDKLRREAEKIGKSSFALAWVMDETAEERSRGVTVDIATNYFETAKTRFTILDAPGHQDFIPNMIAGASQADFAVLVIDASTNSFEAGLKGQTKEHALLVRSMGVQRLIIAVNKMDTTSWSKARFEEITVQMTAFLTSAGFQQKNLSFIPCAGLTGENITTRVTQEGASWYTGPTLVEALDASETMTRALTQPLRLTISDIFRGSVTNPLSVSGRLEAGSVQVGDVVLSMPSGETAAVKGIELETKPADWAVAGQIVTLHLADIDPIHLRIGDILCAPNQPIQNVTAFTAKILAFEHMMPMFIDVFRGRLTTPAKIDKMMAVLDKTSGQVTKKKPRVIKPGEVARVRVELDRPMPLEKGQRVVLRAEGNTVAAGLLEITESQGAADVATSSTAVAASS